MQDAAHRRRVVLHRAQEQNISDTQAQTDAADAGDANGQTDGAAENADGEVTVIKAVTKGSPAPYVTIDENNQPAGSDIEIIKAVFERLPQYELQIRLADDALTGIISGQYDIGARSRACRGGSRRHPGNCRRGLNDAAGFP